MHHFRSLEKSALLRAMLAIRADLLSDIALASCNGLSIVQYSFRYKENATTTIRRQIPDLTSAFDLSISSIHRQRMRGIVDDV
jgi:hypothetical protein